MTEASTEQTMVTVPIGGVPPLVIAGVKPGYQTSEFWLKVAALILTAFYASGLLTSSIALGIAGIAASILASLGYTVSRTIVKARA